MESITKTPTAKIGIVVVWMGRLPSYFPLWVRSLRKNTSFAFFLFTDQPVETDIPANLKVVNMSFDQLKQLIDERLQLKTNFSHAYKLCDFKPAYGEIFGSYLTGYDYWGNCDIDMLFGDLARFITDDLLAAHKKIFSRGHLTLYKNEPAINAAYRSSESIDAKTALQSPQYCFFDEWAGIHRIFDELDIGQYNKEVMGDIKVASTRMVCTNIPNYRPQLFVWEEGDVKQYYLEAGLLKVKELAYVHFQKRKIALAGPGVHISRSLILNPRAILPFNDVITAGTVRQYDRPDYHHYIDSQLKKIKKKLTSFRQDSFNKSMLKA